MEDETQLIWEVDEASQGIKAEGVKKCVYSIQPILKKSVIATEEFVTWYALNYDAWGSNDYLPRQEVETLLDAMRICDEHYSKVKSGWMFVITDRRWCKMEESKYKREDLKCIANKLGYRLYYKGHSIGGSTILGNGSHIRGRAATKQAKDNLESGMRDIDHIISGRMIKMYATYMEEVDQKIESGEWKHKEI